MAQAHPLRASPVLFGRDELLALGRRRLQQARDGTGELLFLAGEAGIGKTRLLNALVREALSEGYRVFDAEVSAGDVELSAGLFLDLGHQLSRSALPGASAIGASITATLAQSPSGSGDAHRRRRIMVLEIVDRLAELAEAGPTLLALEDLHWSDGLSVEVLAQFARRLPALPVLAIATYRSDELYPRVPMRQWRARLLGQRLAEEVRLRRLSFDEVDSMATLLLGGPTRAPRDLVELLHERSDGIPLHLEELVAASAGDLGSSSPRAVPDTLREAILQRCSALSEHSAALAGATAVIGRSFDLELAAAVADQPVEQVAAGVEELVERAFLAPALDGWYDFRHALIRDALESAVPLALRRRLHARVAAVATARRGLGGAAFCSAHYEAAGASGEAHAHALGAAQRAASLSNHREALELFGRAVRCAPDDLSEREMADLLIARAAEAAATDDNRAAAEDYGRAHDLLAGAGDAVAAADVLPRLVAVRGRLAAALSAAYMLDRRLEDSIAHGERAQALAADAGDEATELNALVTFGAVLVFAGRGDGGWPRLEDAVRRARANRFEAEAARAYRMIGSSASVLVEYGRAEEWLRAGIDYAERCELWNDRHYMAAHLGHVLWATGRWAQAAPVVEHAIADGWGGLTTSITALHVRGFLALGRALPEQAREALDEACDLGLRMGELQRLSPALWGLAELALAERRWGDAASLCQRGFEASAAVRDAAYLFPFLVTGTRALIELGDPVAAAAWVEDVSTAVLDRAIPGTLPSIEHARGLLLLAAGSTGQARSSLAAARDGWLHRGRAWEGAWASIDLARCAYRSNRAAEAATLLAQVGTVAAEMGAVHLERAADAVTQLIGGRGTAEVAWAPLTAREFEVAQLVCAGRTNREIAAELTISAKTAASHVEHILVKLGAGRRTEIAAWVVGVRAE
ncbi:MAG: hypothetical protein DLM57_00710 [Pseudonocardiales bacterium]|nr:MAG: hypothetical protein DLM57_00710 [Pseudonocardiales bacterium]